MTGDSGCHGDNTDVQDQDGMLSDTELMLLQFCSGTTAHGLSHLTRSYACGKVFWICMLFFSSCGAIWHLYFVVSNYLKFNHTEATSVSEAPPEFPHVTLCDVSSETNESFAKYLTAENPEDFFLSDMMFLFENFDTLVKRYNHSQKEVKQLWNRLQSAEAMVANLGVAASTEVGVTLQEMLVECRFGPEPCAEENFTLFQHNRFFNCFTYQPQQNSPTVLTGPEEGLSLILYKVGDTHLKTQNFHSLLPSFDFGTVMCCFHMPVAFCQKPQTVMSTFDKSTNIGNAHGLRLTVHEAGAYPAVVDEGVDLQSGVSTSIGLKMNLKKRLYEPYGK